MSVHGQTQLEEEELLYLSQWLEKDSQALSLKLLNILEERLTTITF